MLTSIPDIINSRGNRPGTRTPMTISAMHMMLIPAKKEKTGKLMNWIRNGPMPAAKTMPSVANTPAPRATPILWDKPPSSEAALAREEGPAIIAKEIVNRFAGIKKPLAATATAEPSKTLLLIMNARFPKLIQQRARESVIYIIV